MSAATPTVEDLFDTVDSPILEDVVANSLMFRILTRKDWGSKAIQSDEMNDIIEWFLHTCNRIDPSVEPIPTNLSFLGHGTVSRFEAAMVVYIRKRIKQIPRISRPSRFKAAVSSKLVEKSVSFPIFSPKDVDACLAPLKTRPLLIQFMRKYDVDPVTVDWNKPNMDDDDFCESIWRNVPEKQKNRYMSPRWLRGGVPRMEPDHRLQAFDIAFIFDDSGSMGGPNWRTLKKASVPLSDLASRSNPRGFGFQLMNASSQEVGDPNKGEFDGGYNHCNNPDFVRDVLNSVSLGPSTPLLESLKTVLGSYMDYAMPILKRNHDLRKSGQFDPLKEEKVRPLSVVAVTDGMPNDDRAVEAYLVACARKLDSVNAPKRQVGVQIFQVGNETWCGRWLAKLDDDLKHNYDLQRDMVDCKTDGWIQEEGGFIAPVLAKVIIGAMNSGIDGASKVVKRIW